MRIRNILTKDKFKKWLKRRKKDEIIGIACDSEFCPIASYVSQAVDISDISVEGDSIYHQQNDREYNFKLPHWAYNFVHLLDDNNDEDADITAEHALEVLDNV